jgi:hypothetical protein
VETKADLERLGFGRAQRIVPTLLVPVYDETGTVALHQHRPDEPRRNGEGKPIKYETPAGARMVVDVPPRVRPQLGDPAVPLWITEGVRKADAAVSAGLACVALLGVWNWRGANTADGKTALAVWESVALKDRQVYVAFDSDVMLKDAVRKALVRLGALLTRRGATVAYVYLPAGPGGTKTGLDEHFARGGTVDELLLLARRDPIEPELPDDDGPDSGPLPPQAPRPAPKRRELTDVVATFRRWLHLDDPAPVYAVAAAIVANRAAGDPVWLLVVSAPSTGKAELLSAAAGLPYVCSVATLTASALLSGTSKRERTKDATGGVLRQVGDFGILLAKDFTSVLAQNRDTRAEALAALREVYDGRWDRAVGTDGGRILSWRGKCGLLGGVTPAFDGYHAVVSTLGDRFCCYGCRTSTRRRPASWRSPTAAGKPRCASSSPARWPVSSSTSTPAR